MIQARDVALRLPRRLGPAAAFGVAELSHALVQRGYRLVPDDAVAEIILAISDAQVTQGIPPGGARPESYRIGRLTPDAVGLIARDETGLMYGCLDLAEQFRIGADVSTLRDREGSPELAVRGLYTFLHSSAVERGWLHEERYWRDYADELAWCRFNRFNLIYGHQTAYLIPIYAFLLDDLDSEFPEIRVRGITSEERARNLRALQMASTAMASRNIGFFLGVWESRPWTIANGVWETQPTRVTGTDDLGLLAAYTQRGFLRLMDLCPDVRGVQLRMNVESGVADQRFFVHAFVPALRRLAESGRQLTVELRNWGLHPDTLEAFRGAGAEIVVSTKYFAEHQAMPYQPPAMRGSYSYDSFLRRDKPFPFQWHLWSLGSHRLFNWGDPDYARRFVRSCHLGDGVGFEVTPPGSQKGFSQWGEVSPTDWQPRHDLPARRDFERYWFFHLAFGRMGYDPTTGDEIFLWQLARRTSQEAAPALLAAYRAASKIVSYLVSQRMDDPNMYVWPELDAGGPIDHNLIAPPGEATLFATAQEHAVARLAGAASAKLSPLAAATDLERLADTVESHLATVSSLPNLTETAEVQTVRVDFAALAALARYHAMKSRASGSLALFYESGERRFLDDAEAAAERCVALWDELCRRTEVYSASLHLGPSGGHWRDNRPRVLYDLRRIRRVRELFDAHGLFFRGFDFGPPPVDRQRPSGMWRESNLEPEPRFLGVDPSCGYSRDRGYGWLRPAGLRAVGLAPLPRDLLWGVRYVRPDSADDPAAIETVPLDGLTHRYLTADGERTFRIDAPDGDYELTVVGPATIGSTTGVRVGATAATLGAPSESTATLRVHSTHGHVDLSVDGGPWALAGLVVRRLEPEIGHLPRHAVRAEEDLPIAATATAPYGVRAATLCYRTAAAGDEATGSWRETALVGDGVVFAANVPAADLVGTRLEYQVRAEGRDGRSASVGPFAARIVHGYRGPRVTRLAGPRTWRKPGPLTFAVAVENGESAAELRLHYKEADQNRSLRTALLPGGRSGEHLFYVESKHLDDAYDLIYFVEVADVLGGGSFYPDPFEDARYFVCRASG